MADEVAALVVLVLRVAVVAALYLFLFQVFRTLRAELSAASHASQATSGEALTDWLEVVACDEAVGLTGKLYPLEPVSTIGRDPDNTVMIPDRRVSARHARLLWRSGHWWVEDLGSTNGTFLNGQPVNGLTRLAGQDALRLGPTTLRVRSA